VKRILFVILFFLIAVNLKAQENNILKNQNSLFGLSSKGLGGYGGPQFRISKTNGESGLTGGGPIGIVIKPNFKAFISFNYLEGDASGVKFWYPAFGAEYTFFAKSSVQLNVNTQIGYGKATQKSGNFFYQSSLLSIDPEVTAGIKITESERLKIGGGYHLGLIMNPAEGLFTNNMSGFYATVYLTYGIFNIDRRNEILATHKKLVYLSGSYSMKFTSLNGQLAILDGGGTRLMINRRFGIGASGYRTIRTVDYKGNEFSIIYGGIWFYYPINMTDAFHLSLSGLVGYGGAGYIHKNSTGKDEIIGTGIPIIDPDIFANLNITEFMQLGIGAGYRIALGKFEDIGFNKLSGISGCIQLRFGGF